MARLSDIIERFLKEMILEADGIIEIQRNELANHFNCVPSQINYVIGTRFSPDKGYYVESRRGGGGSIKITKINLSGNNYIMHIVSSIAPVITQQMAEIYINNFIDYDIITPRESKIMMACLSDKVLYSYDENKDIIRSNILKNILLNIV